MSIDFAPMPDDKGYFGEYGGQVIPPQLIEIMDDINDAYEKVRQTEEFQQELASLNADYTGRPSPIYYAKRLSDSIGGAKIFLKREDLNHTGAHKINHCLGEALLAKHMGKTKVLAETGAGQHGVALATACALVGIECEIHMGQIDIEKEHPNVTKMKILGCKLVPVTRGTQTLKDAVDSAFEEYLKDPVNSLYAIGSVVGPHPFPRMVRDFQSIVGREAREQFLEKQGKLPDIITACVGGGSNAIGLFTAFLNDEDVKLVGVEPAGKGLDTNEHAATLTLGSKGAIHGFECYNLQDDEGNPLPVYSIASGLDYPGVGPQHCYLKDIKRVEYETADDKECLDAFMTLSRLEGIIPALESAHAVAYAMRKAATMSPDQTILINLSGRGDKDADFVADKLGL
ncbi:MAG: tryptophan synthase subunit beta [Gammaproteobacteria bacterium]|jgi:tryptophan synthase beta chain|nr:tryptophan synthase subunit beta [Gammaproteobacteria bacterium]MBT3722778.1 tryptophan synthase subunit beta [Gammaproteobacteria bacterium]MBT4077341.1 tryptophan synthase subunit beta [Gammaproteobacteria bacterium]MBT4193435.1 tryptophan synthase subunit beta [Gammaproteobacteria bacterium]MBT4450352.1 tryptophan synthase subunit beta [Gammaproteobacteria bacterium]